jgi:hypothetical protein
MLHYATLTWYLCRAALAPPPPPYLAWCPFSSSWRPLPPPHTFPNQLRAATSPAPCHWPQAPRYPVRDVSHRAARVTMRGGTLCPPRAHADRPPSSFKHYVSGRYIHILCQRGRSIFHSQYNGCPGRVSAMAPLGLMPWHHQRRILASCNTMEMKFDPHTPHPNPCQ